MQKIFDLKKSEVHFLPGLQQTQSLVTLFLAVVAAEKSDGQEKVLVKVVGFESSILRD